MSKIDLEKIKKAFAIRLKELRAEKGLTQKELAKMLSVSIYTIGRWERSLSIPNLNYIFKIAKVFGVTVPYLLGE